MKEIHIVMQQYNTTKLLNKCMHYTARNKRNQA